MFTGTYIFRPIGYALVMLHHVIIFVHLAHDVQKVFISFFIMAMLGFMYTSSLDIKESPMPDR